MSAGAAAPLIVTATFGAADHGWLQGLRNAHFPPERNQVPVHLTLFHQLPPSIEGELRSRLGEMSAYPPPRAQIGGVMDLGSGTAFRIVSEELEAMRADLAAAFRTLLTPQDSAGWRPHVTVQNKVKRADATALQQLLQADTYPRSVAIHGLMAWRYLGGPWEPVRAYPFRG